MGNEPEQPKAPPDSIVFKYIKSTQFRVVHVDGVYGGVTPKLQIHMAPFNERRAIPRKVKHALKPDGTLGPEETLDSEEGMIREMEATLVFDVLTAKRIIKWLGEKVEQIETLQKQVDGPAEKKG